MWAFGGWRPDVAVTRHVNPVFTCDVMRNRSDPDFAGEKIHGTGREQLDKHLFYSN